MRFEPVAWMDDANCTQTDPELFFPEKGEPAHYARSICEPCRVKQQCLDYAIGNGFHLGVWGGLTPKERSAVAKARAKGGGR